jgi:hypothetical protein
VELKFAAPKIHSHISIYNMLFDVQPSIWSLVQCNRCFHFSHMQKFCRNKSRCNNFSGDDLMASFNACLSAHTTDPIYLFLKSSSFRYRSQLPQILVITFLTLVK